MGIWWMIVTSKKGWVREDLEVVSLGKGVNKVVEKGWSKFEGEDELVWW